MDRKEGNFSASRSTYWKADTAIIKKKGSNTEQHNHEDPSGSLYILKKKATCYRTCGLTEQPCCCSGGLGTATNLSRPPKETTAKISSQDISPSITGLPLSAKKQRNPDWQATQISIGHHGHQSTHRCFLQCMMERLAQRSFYFGAPGPK